MTDKYYVYEHIRDDTQTVFYVGKGSGNRAFNTRQRTEEWKELVSTISGFSVNFVKTDLSEEDAYAFEIERILELRSYGVVLLNKANGGRGSLGCKRTEEDKAKHSKLVKEYWSNPKARKRQSDALKKFNDDNERAKKSRKTKELWENDDYRSKITNKIKKSQAELWKDPEYKKQQSAKVSEGMKAMWARRKENKNVKND